jgi:hypothetical protein
VPGLRKISLCPALDGYVPRVGSTSGQPFPVTCDLTPETCPLRPAFLIFSSVFLPSRW